MQYKKWNCSTPRSIQLSLQYNYKQLTCLWFKLKINSSNKPLSKNFIHQNTIRKLSHGVSLNRLLRFVHKLYYKRVYNNSTNFSLFRLCIIFFWNNGKISLCDCTNLQLTSSYKTMLRTSFSKQKSNYYYLKDIQIH